MCIGSRPIEGTPKTITITSEADGWYVAILCADVPMNPLPPTGQETGIDLGLESFATLTSGERIVTPSYYRKAEAYLRQAASGVSARRKKGSNRSRKAVTLLAKAHQQSTSSAAATSITRRTSRWCEQYDVIYYEDLRVGNMVKNHHLAKSNSDAGWTAFLTVLSFQSSECWESECKRLILRSLASRVQAAASMVHKGLSVRWHACPDCGTSLRWDQNAALNILRQGREQCRSGYGLQAST